MLLYQRMQPDKSLELTVKKVLEFAPTLLPAEHKRVAEGTLSSNPSGYSRARKKCLRKAVKKLANTVSQTLIERTKTSLDGRRVTVIDGTTITLGPDSGLRSVFPPARNPYGESPLPIALLVMGFELESGAAILPQVGAIYGDNAVSETAMVSQLIQQLSPDDIVMADSGYGNFEVAWQVHVRQRDSLLRLTAVRFEALRRQATLVEQRGNVTSYTLRWRPSRNERASRSDLPPDALIAVRLHAIRISDTLTLYLVTTLTTAGGELAELYRYRNDAEIDIRNFKVTHNAEQSRVRSHDMFMKERWMSLVSDNLVCQFRREAAKQAQLEPRELSFKRVLSTFETFLLSRLFKTPSEARRAFDRALTRPKAAKRREQLSLLAPLRDCCSEWARELRAHARSYSLSPLRALSCRQKGRSGRIILLSEHLIPFDRAGRALMTGLDIQRERHADIEHVILLTQRTMSLKP